MTETDLDRPYNEAKERFVREFKRRYVAALLAKTGGNVSEAARLARVDRSAFRRLRRDAEARG